MNAIDFQPLLRHCLLPSLAPANDNAVRSPYGADQFRVNPLTRAIRGEMIAPPSAEDDSGHDRKKAFRMAGLVALSLTGIAAPAAYAQVPPPQPSTSTTVERSSSTTNSADGFIIAGPNQVGVVTEQPAAQQTAAPIVLPQPTDLSRNRVDRVELNAHLERMAGQVGVDPDLLKSIAWQESNWTHARRGGELVSQSNVNRESGEVLSVDSGIMQINSKAHPHAFPKAYSLDGNIEYGARLLKSIVDKWGDGPTGVWRYNGDPEYGPLIQRHREVKPWTEWVLGDHLDALRREKTALERSVPAAERALPGAQKKVDTARLNVEGWQRKVDNAATEPTRKANTKELNWAQRTLGKAEEKLTAATESLDRDKARLAALPAEIDAVAAQAKTERARIDEIEAREYTEQAEALRATLKEYVPHLTQLRREATQLVQRLQKMASEQATPNAEIDALTAQATALKTRLTEGETTWKQYQTRVNGKRKFRPRAIQRELKDSRRVHDEDAAKLKALKKSVETLRKTLASQPHANPATQSSAPQ
ncbi:MAG: hypothetical protein FJX76_05380 [Armatimonadetes bacterium]|nr:hypothetical protein [Armatimonadota bacterium]